MKILQDKDERKELQLLLKEMEQRLKDEEHRSRNQSVDKGAQDK